MAGWRQAVALAMTGEEIESTDRALSRSRDRNWQAGCRGQRCCSAIGRSHRSLPWDEDLACIIRRCSAAPSERWPMARLRHLMTDRDRAKSRRSRRRPRPAWYLWPATRPRSTAIRMNCGRHGFWLGRKRERGPAAGHQCPPPVWLKAPCASFSVKEEIKPHKVRSYLERRDAEFEPKMAEVLCVSPRGPWS